MTFDELHVAIVHEKFDHTRLCWSLTRQRISTNFFDSCLRFLITSIGFYFTKSHKHSLGNQPKKWCKIIIVLICRSGGCRFRATDVHRFRQLVNARFWSHGFVRNWQMWRFRLRFENALNLPSTVCNRFVIVLCASFSFALCRCRGRLCIIRAMAAQGAHDFVAWFAAHVCGSHACTYSLSAIIRFSITDAMPRSCRRSALRKRRHGCACMCVVMSARVGALPSAHKRGWGARACAHTDERHRAPRTACTARTPLSRTADDICTVAGHVHNRLRAVRALAHTHTPARTVRPCWTGAPPDAHSRPASFARPRANDPRFPSVWSVLLFYVFLFCVKKNFQSLI
jgi:hypothetical protein